jgi:hypothetical protein
MAYEWIDAWKYQGGQNSEFVQLQGGKNSDFVLMVTSIPLCARPPIACTVCKSSMNSKPAGTIASPFPAYGALLFLQWMTAFIGGSIR